MGVSSLERVHRGGARYGADLRAMEHAARASDVGDVFIDLAAIRSNVALPRALLEVRRADIDPHRGKRVTFGAKRASRVVELPVRDASFDAVIVKRDSPLFEIGDGVTDVGEPLSTRGSNRGE
jgi:hypothetical protein